jgi:hypothetical protein
LSLISAALVFLGGYLFAAVLSMCEILSRRRRRRSLLLIRVAKLQLKVSELEKKCKKFSRGNHE